MRAEHLLPLFPLLVMLTWAAVEDLHCRRIRNWLTFSMVLTGFAQSVIGPSAVTPLFSMLGFLVGAALLTALFGIGAVGGGDVKLLAGVGAWLGPMAAFEIFCAEAVIGMVIVLTQAAAQGRLRVLSRNTAVVAINLLHVNEVGLEHTTATGQSCRSVDRPLPYAVPVLLAVVAHLIGLLP